MAEDDSGLREQLVEAYRQLGPLGLTFGSSGNVSLRGGPGMIITRSGATIDGVTVADTVAMELGGKVHDRKPPSSEWSMHAAIYRAYDRAHCVVHTHADACTALACLGLGIPPFHYMVAGFGGADIRCTPYATFGTPALAELAVEGLRNRTACLLGNHGMICYGKSAAAALALAVRLEALARQYLLARSGGTPRLLTPDQIAEARERYKSYGDAAPPPTM